ncbi:MAG: YybH family protein [Trueperaceae bacterium]
MKDEQAIRDVITTWQEATKVGNLSRLLELMTDDVVFLTSGQPPMNKEGFSKGFESILKKMTIVSRGDIQEIVVSGDYAYSWSHLSVTMTPKDGNNSIRRLGHTLTFFRKENGSWRLARDANMLTTDKEKV